MPHEARKSVPDKPTVSAPFRPIHTTLPNLAPLIASAAEPEPPEPPEPEPPSPPNPDTILALGNGTSVVVELTQLSYSEPPALKLILRREKEIIAEREGFDAITHIDRKKLHPCDSWSASLRRESLGPKEAIRISLICATGEDYLTSSEVAVLVKPDSLQTIWAGLADRFENTMDSCFFSRHMAFVIIPPKTLQITIVEETTWKDQVIDESLKSQLKRDCKIGSQRRVEKVKVP